MTIDEVCARVGKSKRTVRQWIADGYLRPAYKVSRAHHYREMDALDAERRTRRGLPPPGPGESRGTPSRRRYPLTESWLRGDWSISGNPFLDPFVE